MSKPRFHTKFIEYSDVEDLGYVEAHQVIGKDCNFSQFFEWYLMGEFYFSQSRPKSLTAEHFVKITGNSNEVVTYFENQKNKHKIVVKAKN